MFGASCPNRTVFLHSPVCSSLVASDPLSLTWMSLSFLFLLVLCDVTARSVRMSNRHLLIIFLTWFLRHIHCTKLNSSSSHFSVSLSPSDSVLACFPPGFSRQDSLDNRSESLSECISALFCRFSLRCKQLVSRTTSHVSVCFNVRRQDAESPTLILSVSRPQFLAS